MGRGGNQADRTTNEICRGENGFGAMSYRHRDLAPALPLRIAQLATMPGSLSRCHSDNQSH